MYNCASCGSQHTDGPVCSTCKRHYDFQCSGVTEASFRKLGDRKNNWRCRYCKSSTSPTSVATLYQPSQLDKIQDQLGKIALELEPLASLAADVKGIKSELSSLKESLEMAHELIGCFTDKMKTLEAKIVKAEKAASEVASLKAEINGLNQQTQARDQWARANNVEIQGVPHKRNENLYELAQKIGKNSGFPITKEEINYIARVPTRVSSAEKPIIIAFNSRYTKEEFIAAARKNKQQNLSDLGFPTTSKFYVNDHLTTSNKILLSKARTLAKQKAYQYIWVKHCKIMVRKSDTSPAFFIKCETDLKRIT